MTNKDKSTEEDVAGAIPNDLSAGKSKSAIGKLYLLFVGILATILIIGGIGYLLNNLQSARDNQGKTTSVFDQITNSKPRNFDADKAGVLAAQQSAARAEDKGKEALPPPTAATPQTAYSPGMQRQEKPEPTPAEIARARRLAGAVWADGSSAFSAGIGQSDNSREMQALNQPPGQITTAGLGEQGDSNSYAGRLVGTSTPTTRARLIPDLDFLLPKGTNIRCTNNRLITTDYPGAAQCIISNDVYSANGRILLIERGSAVNGEYRADLKHGQSRIFVLWTDIVTPNGVKLMILSGGADSLGGSGHPAQIETHFWKRFGGALLFSIVDDGLQIAVNETSKNSDGTSVNISSSSNTASQFVGKALDNSINIPPTGYVFHGDILNINASRDVDFREVYDAIRQ